MIDDLAVFKKITFSEVTGGPSVACDRLPDLPAVYAFVRPIWLPDEADGEASLSVYKANNPAKSDQPFLLIVRTQHVVTTFRG